MITMTRFLSVPAAVLRYSKLGACAALLASSVCNAQAGLAEFEAIQAAHPHLLNQWKFEGHDDSTRLADSSSAANHLVRTPGREGGDINNIVFGAGFDGVSQSYQPEYVAQWAGAGLLSTRPTTLPASLTAEAVFQLDDWEEAEVSYLICARPLNRAYMLLQTGRDGTNFLTSIFGDTFTDRPVVLEYIPGDWYYVAAVASFDIGTGITSVDWYGANLTQGDVAIALLASDNNTFTGDWVGSDVIGVGNYRNGAQNYLQGRLDNVGITGALLTPDQLQQRLDALFVGFPEPGTLRLIAKVQESDLQHKQPLLASLEEALASIRRDNCRSAVGQLHAFQNKVSAQVTDANLALALVENAGEIITALNCDGGSSVAAKIHSLKRHLNGKIQMKIKGEAGKAYILEGSSNLVDWEPICVVRPDENGDCDYEDILSDNYPCRFYRLVER